MVIAHANQLREAIKVLRTKKMVTIDIETFAKPEFLHIKKAALHPYLNNILTINIGDPNNQYIIDCRKVDPTSLLKLIYANPKIEKIGANLKFDYKCLLHHYGVRGENLFDIMLCDQTVYNNLYTSYSLQALSERYEVFKYPEASQLCLFPTPTKKVREEFINFNEETEFTEIQLEYMRFDIIIPYKIKEKQEKIIQKEKLESAVKLQNEFLEVLAEMELNGIFLNQKKWLETLEKNRNELSSLEEKLKIIKDINWNSHKQVKEVFKENNIPILIEKNGELKESVQETHIKAINHPLVPLYIKYKHKQKQVSAYGEKFLRHINPSSGRIHSNYIQILSTGRTASTDPNMQNIPSKVEGFRECFETEHEFLNFDFSNQEVRILTEYSQDKVLVNFFKTGDGDQHSLTARNIFKVPVSKHENAHLREQAKALNFALNYGAGAHKVSKMLDIPFKRAKELVEGFFNTYEGVRTFYDKKLTEALEKGYIVIDEGITNSRTYLPNFKRFKVLESYIKSVPRPDRSLSKEYSMLLSEYTRLTMNYPIQGTGALMMKLACVYIHKLIKKKNLFDSIKIVNIIHDELMYEVKGEFSHIIIDSMSKASSYFCKTIQIPSTVNCSKYWQSK